jgi:ATP-dependent helicase/DNAse subunit B
MAKLGKWSVSKLKCYQDCPYKFYCNHILKLYDTDNQKALTWGSSFHEAVEYFFSDFTYPSKKELLEYYKDHWIAEQYVKDWNKLKLKNSTCNTWSFLGYQSSEEELEYYELGMRMLSDFWNRHFNFIKLPFATELKFEEKLPNGEIFTGFIDRVDYISNLFRILDYKTGKWETNAIDLKKDLQLGLYHWVFCKKYNLPYNAVEYCALYYTRSSNLIPISYYKSDIESLLETTISIITKVDSDYFPKTPKKDWLCKNCQYNGKPCDRVQK